MGSKGRRIPAAIGKVRFEGYAAALCAAGATFIASCGGGGGGGSGSSEPPGGGGIPLEEGTTVAELEVVVPDMDTFIVRGTVPVPAGTYPAADGKQPFGVVDWDAQTFGAQTEIVSRRADVTDGADVVEVIAVVNRDPALAPGQRTRYRVVRAAHAPQPNPGSAGVEDLEAPLNIPPSVLGLLGNVNNIQIRAFDCFGNKYTTRPLDGSGSAKLTRYGEHTAELKVYQTLQPDPPVGGGSGTLPHFFSVHCYISTFNGEEMVGFDLRVNNGHSGHDGGTSDDDPLDTIYFERLEILVPGGWSVVQDYDDPFVGNAYAAGGKTAYPIVMPNGDGTMHVMEWLAQFHRRIAIVRTGQGARARDYLRGAGVGFARRGTDPAEGHEYWSWWNQLTPRWFPQKHILPSLAHIGPAAVEADIVNEKNAAQGHLENGTSTGLYPFAGGVMGWAHPYGVGYGGMSGGAEINLFDGVRTLEAASQNGYELFRIVHRMATDRMPVALYNVDGEPTSVEDWLTPNPGGCDYVPFEMFLSPYGGMDPFGLDDAPQFQIQYVQGSGLEPAYQAALWGYDPHDYQHLIRYTRNAKVLTWLTNDSVAKDDLRLIAENFNLAYHPYCNGPGGGIQGSGMKADLDYVATLPGKGFAFGRGEAWGLDVMAAAYSIEDNAWRNEKRPWFDTLSNMVDDGQTPCLGMIQAIISPQFLSGKYRARQAVEGSITENALLGMIETVYRGESGAFTAMMENVLEDQLYASISDVVWFPGQSGPWFKSGVGPLDEAQPMWCSMGDVPPDGYEPFTDKFQNWSSFAYGYEVSGGDNKFLNYATTQIGGGDLLTELEADGLDNLYNKAGILALMQVLNGDL